MEKVIFNNKGGAGIILDQFEEEADYITPEPVILHGTDLKPNELTTLDGMFLNPLRYVGLLKNSEFKEMCFHAGNTQNLFATKKYYYIFYLIDENRIANTYSYGTVRDFFWKNDHWH